MISQYDLIKFVKEKVPQKMETMSRIALILLAACTVRTVQAEEKKMAGKEIPGRWSKEEANQWYDAQPWPCGFNYIPAHAISYTEMWMPYCFDAALIDKELALAEEVGFNCLRVVLPFVVWQHDPDAFKQRIEAFLEVCDKRGLKVMLTLFDDCVFGPIKDPVYGKQPGVVEGWYANGWTPSPGHGMVRDPATWPRLESYVKDVMETFKDDPRVWVWDLYNEPMNSGLGEASLPLVKSVFEWAREVDPPQPLTVGHWFNDSRLNDLIFANSDIISFHYYGRPGGLLDTITMLQGFGRPVINTEWLNRPIGSEVASSLPVFLENKVGCMHWGLVNGKTQTHLNWGHRPGNPPPVKWQHDLFHGDHTPYDENEIDLFRLSIGRANEMTSDWKPVEGRLMTRWAGQVDPDHPLPEYPRPQMRRENWLNLNGLWDFALLAEKDTRFHAVAPTSENTPVIWRISEEMPGPNWFMPDFDDSTWSQKPGGFGKRGTPNANIATPWETSDLWLRRTFHVERIPEGIPALRIHFDEDVEVYLNGKMIFAEKGYLSEYTLKPLGREALKAWKTGENVLAVRVRQTAGGQYVDVGLGVVEAFEPKTTLDYPRKILVPFAVESALSGIGEAVQPGDNLYYRRTFTVPENMNGQRILLHFGAVDWEATVFVNDRKVGTHRGGYAPFHVDVTDALNARGLQEVRLVIRDPTSSGYQPRGKQTLAPGRVWYTAVSGIWGTVWLEGVPKTYVHDLHMVSDVSDGILALSVHTKGQAEGVVVRATASLEGRVVAVDVAKAGDPVSLKIDDAFLWSPSSPTLYDLTVTLEKDGTVLDTVDSYFAMREIAIEKDERGINRLFLNGKPLFQYGLLDQGWWPDGLYTAPTDDALRFDVEKTKELGFNMIRKHVKVEPLRWYMHCDQLGLLVWQDMPNGSNEDDEGAGNFYHEWGEIMDSLKNHPSIVMWVPFNEGWGQFDTEKVAAWTGQRDPSRLVNNASGWHDKNVGDVRDVHSYPGPASAAIEDDRAIVLGEFGGLGYVVDGHLWLNERNWGYVSFTTRDELQEAYSELQSKLRPLVASSLAAAVYTQTTDVEGEVNGLMTYDREVLKFDPQEMKRQHDQLKGILDAARSGENK